MTMTIATVDNVTLDDDRVRILQAYIRPSDVRDIPGRTGLPVELVREVVASVAGNDRVYARHLVEQFALLTGPTAPPNTGGPAAVSPEPEPAEPAAVDLDTDSTTESGVVVPVEVTPELEPAEFAELDGAEQEFEVEARPRIVALCGSTRFRDALAAVNAELTLAGAMVLAPGVFGHADGVELGPQVQSELDTLHLHKIDLADEVIVVAPGGYIGDSTRAAIVYAQMLGKPVSYRSDDVPSSLLRTGGSYLCQHCGTAAGAGLCCGQPMVPVRVELHRRAA